jgi:hypothetical protein
LLCFWFSTFFIDLNRLSFESRTRSHPEISRYSVKRWESKGISKSLNFAPLLARKFEGKPEFLVNPTWGLLRVLFGHESGIFQQNWHPLMLFGSAYRKDGRMGTKGNQVKKRRSYTFLRWKLEILAKREVEKLLEAGVLKRIHNAKFSLSPTDSMKGGSSGNQGSRPVVTRSRYDCPTLIWMRKHVVQIGR